jgi:hypothetical protein
LPHNHRKGRTDCVRHIDSADHAVDFRGEYASSHSLAFGRALMNQISVDCELVVSGNLVRKNDFVSDLRAIIFVICERSIDEDE